MNKIETTARIAYDSHNRRTFRTQMSAGRKHTLHARRNVTPV